MAMVTQNIRSTSLTSPDKVKQWVIWSPPTSVKASTSIQQRHRHAHPKWPPLVSGEKLRAKRHGWSRRSRCGLMTSRTDKKDREIMAGSAGQWMAKTLTNEHLENLGIKRFDFDLNTGTTLPSATQYFLPAMDDDSRFLSSNTEWIDVVFTNDRKIKEKGI